MERLKHLKEALMCCAESQMSNLANVDAEELGEVIDMIKDLEEAIYYCTITKAMGEQDEEMKMMKKHGMMNGNGGQNGEAYYSEMYPYDRMYPPMYYNGNSNMGANSTSGSNANGTWNASGQYYPMYNDGSRQYYENGNGDARNTEKEGRAGRSRRQYMEAKEKHSDKTTQMRELEKYMQELSSDIIEMIEEASPEERQYLSKKIAALATKVDKLG